MSSKSINRKEKTAPDFTVDLDPDCGSTVDVYIVTPSQYVRVAGSTPGWRVFPYNMGQKTASIVYVHKMVCYRCDPDGSNPTISNKVEAQELDIDCKWFWQWLQGLTQVGARKGSEQLDAGTCTGFDTVIDPETGERKDWSVYS